MKTFEPFRFWCQKVLPLVYDDSLSYYELLCKVVDFCNNLAESLNVTNETLEQLSNYIIEKTPEEVERVINEMVEDGTLGALINDELLGEINEKVEALEFFQRVYTSWTGWEVFISQAGYISAGITISRTVTESHYFDNGLPNHYSEEFYLPAPTPIKYGNLVGCGDREGAWVSNINITKNSGISFRVWFPYDYSTPKTLSIRFVLTTTIKSAPEHTSVPYNAVNAQQLIDIAQTYVNAQRNGRAFGYGRNFFYVSQPDNIINNSNGQGMMECDTFVGMCLRGIPYNKSPYVNTQAGFTYDYSDLYKGVSGATAWVANHSYSVGDIISIEGKLSQYWECTTAHTSGTTFNSTYWKSIWVVNPDNIAWSTVLNNIMHPTNKYLKRDVLFAPDYAFMSWMMNNVVFSSKEDVKTGDVAFWVRRSHERTYWGGYSQSAGFDNIAHVGIVSVEDGVRYLYHVSSSRYTQGRIVEKRTLDDMDEQPDYFARLV